MPSPQVPDTTLVFPFNDDDGVTPLRRTNDIYLKDPSNITSGIEYDLETNSYVLKKKIGTIQYRNPYYIGFDDYRNLDFEKSVDDYWR